MFGTPQEIRPKWRHFLPAGLLLIASVVAITFLVSRPATDQKQLAILLPPWDGPLQAAALAAKAGGVLVDSGGLSNVFIVFSERPGFIGALYRAGAWVVMNPITAHGCLSAPPTQGI